MAEVQPLKTLRYDRAAVGSLDAVAAPPYDVIDAPLRAELAAKSPFNVVEVDLPQANGDDPYLHAQTIMEAWRQQGVVMREREPAIWAMTQDYTGPDGTRPAPATASSAACAWRTTARAASARTSAPSPGPKEDRLRLTRATRANLSPIFSLFPDPEQPGLEGARAAHQRGAVRHRHRRRRHAQHALAGRRPGARSRRSRTRCADRELLIADGHHRYETARVYAEEIGGEGEHRYVLMFLCSLQDPGLTIFPTHRLLRTSDDEQARGAARHDRARLRRRARSSADELEPPAGDGRSRSATSTRFHKQPAAPDAQGPGDRRRRAARQARRRTAGSTPPCSRRSCSRARSA